MSADSLFEQGRRLAESGQLDAAEQAFREADSAGSAPAATALGAIAEARGEHTTALEAYARADQRGDGTGALRLGLLLASADRWPDAQKAFKRADERGSEPLMPALQRLIDDRRGEAAVATGAAGSGALAGDASARPARPSPLASPVLVGAVTVLVALTAVFLSYNANRGLPFVPTKELKVDISNGANLVPGGDVREGGFRIGLISQMKPIELPNGTPGAELILKLDQAHDQVPIDSTATIETRSVTGLKYVSINVGSSRKLIADGGVLPVSHTTVPVQNDDIYKIFDRQTRRAVDHSLVGYGDALTGRGSSLNDLFAVLPALLDNLQQAAHYLSQPSTQLIPFLNATDRFVSAIVPVSKQNVQFLADMGVTFGAIDHNPQDLRLTNAESPGTLDAGISSFRQQAPFLRDFVAFSRALAPGTIALNHALPDVVPAIEIGTPTLRRTVTLNAELQRVFNSLYNLARNPGTNIALNALSHTTSTLNPMIRYLGPYVSVCNDWNYWWTFLAEHLSEKTNFGFGQRALLNTASPGQHDGLGALPAAAPANGQGGGNEFVHDPTYGAAVDTQGNADCETGQRGYVYKLNSADPLGRPLDTDVHTPGSQGTTFTGVAHVPKGETFSRTPQTGPQLSYPAGNR